MIGYSVSVITPRLTPKVAMIKENSPICARLNPDCIATFKLSPEAMTPNVAKIIRPISTTKVRIITSTPYSAIIAGSIIIPTDTKKTAPNRFFKGSMRCSICLDSIVSANIDPIIKAPKAAEKPTIEAKRTIPRQSPIATINKVSSFKYFFSFLSIVGII